MSVLFYLMRKHIKNYFLSLKKNPAKLIGYLLTLVFMGGMIAISFLGKQDTSRVERPIKELMTIIASFFMLIFWMSLYSGLERGATFFKMPDVNLLFTAPISSKKVLIYGIVKQMGMNILIAFFIIYQMPTLTRIYGIHLNTIWVILGSYLLLLFSAQIAGMAVYIYANGNTKRKKSIQFVLNGVLIILGAVLILNLNQGMGLLEAAVGALRLLDYVPFVGSLKGIIYAAITGDFYLTWIYIGISSISIAAVMLIILKSNADYYEDVLSATEYMEEVVAAAKKGNLHRDSGSKLKGEKIKSFGLKRGQGASSIFYKQLLENRRSSKFGINILTLVQIVAALAAAYFLGKAETLENDVSMLIILGFLVYIQLLSSFAGRWENELRFHYIYLIPQKGLYKMFYASLQGIVNAALEGAAIFIPAGVLLRVNPLLILLCILMRVSFNNLLIAVSMLLQRIFGVTGKTGLFMLVYILSAFLFASPGLIIALVLGIIAKAPLGVPNSIMVGLGATIAYNFLSTLVTALFSNQIFTQMELNSKS